MALTHSLLPQPCADAAVPVPPVSLSLAADYGDRFRVYENVARYRRDGARTYLAGLEDQLARCGAGGSDDGYRLVAVDPIGPGTVLFLGQYDEGDRWVAYVAAAVDRYVVVAIARIS